MQTGAGIRCFDGTGAQDIFVSCCYERELMLLLLFFLLIPMTTLLLVIVALDIPHTASSNC